MPPALDPVELLDRLVAIESTSRLSNRPLADFVCERLERPGIEIRRQPSADGEKENLVVRVGPAADGSGAGLTLSGHMDTVPADEDGWSSPPFRLTDRGDRWVARGACDMKGFLALAVALAAELADEPLAAPLALLFTYDEELGSLGAQRFAADPGEPLPRRTVVGEPTSLRVVRMHKGHLRLRLTLTGASAHSGYPHRGVNAIEPAGEAIRALAALRRELEGERPAAAEHFSEVPWVALNLGRVEGGSAVNVVPDSCRLDLGLRPLPGMDPAAVVERVRGALAGALADADWRLETVNDSPPLDLPAAAPIHRELARLVGQTASQATAFSSDAGTLARLGLDCVLFGPGSIEAAHRPDEHLPKAEMARAGEVLRSLAARCCREGASP